MTWLVAEASGMRTGWPRVELPLLRGGRQRSRAAGPRRWSATLSPKRPKTFTSAAFHAYQRRAASCGGRGTSRHRVEGRLIRRQRPKHCTAAHGRDGRSPQRAVRRIRRPRHAAAVGWAASGGARGWCLIARGCHPTTVLRCVWPPAAVERTSTRVGKPVGAPASVDLVEQATWVSSARGQQSCFSRWISSWPCG